MTSENSSDTISSIDFSEEDVLYKKLDQSIDEKETAKKSQENEASMKLLDSNHPLIVKYQKDLKARLLDLLQETNEHLTELKRTVEGKELENKHFAEKGYELQKQLKSVEEKLKSIYYKCEDQVKSKEELSSKCEAVKREFERIEETWDEAVKRDLELQTKLEEAAFEVVQLTALQDETFTDSKSLQRAVEKTTKERENLEIQKLRQDLVIARLENDKFNLEDKINLYKEQWRIKKEEANELRKELHAANSEMEVIQIEKQQIVHQWRQSIASLSKQDRVLAEIRETVQQFEDGKNTVDMDIQGCKKALRRELERNEELERRMRMRDADIARVRKELQDSADRGADIEQDIAVLERMVEITEQELAMARENNLQLEKEIEAKDRELQKTYAVQKTLEQKHLEILHEKMTVTKASKYTEKLIKDIKNSILVYEEKGSKKENEREKLILKLDNLRSHLQQLQDSFGELLQERTAHARLLDRSEEDILKTRLKLDAKRGETKELEDALKKMIDEAGGEELGPFERELSNLRKEIATAELGKKNTEQEYLRFQKELFCISKQAAVKSGENDFFQKKIAVMEGKKLQLEADISKEEKEIKDISNRIQNLRRETVQLNKILCERKDIQEELLQSVKTSKCDYSQELKEAELHYLQKEHELKLLRRNKKKEFRELIETQRQVVYWEGKTYLAEETRKKLKSEEHLNQFSNLKSEIRKLQLKLDHVKKDQNNFVQELSRAVYVHSNLYIEADKQALFGKRRKTPEYVQKKIKHARKQIRVDKKELEVLSNQVEELRETESALTKEYESEHMIAADMMSKIRSIEFEIENKDQEKRQAVIKLSFKQKKSKLMQKVLDGSYIRAIRNEARRPEEVRKIESGLCAVQVIAQSALNEHPGLEKILNKVLDYITVSKQI